MDVTLIFEVCIWGITTTAVSMILALGLATFFDALDEKRKKK